MNKVVLIHKPRYLEAMDEQTYASSLTIQLNIRVLKISWTCMSALKVFFKTHNQCEWAHLHSSLYAILGAYNP